MIQSNSIYRYSILLGATFLLLLSVGSSRAALVTWDRTAGTSGTYSTGSNWAGGTAPANSLTQDTAVFDGLANASAAMKPNITASTSIYGIEVVQDTTFSSLTLSANSGDILTIGAGGITTTGTASMATTFSTAIALGAAQTWTFGGAHTTGVSGVISNGVGGPFLLTIDVIASNGVYGWGGSSTYTGGTVIYGTGSTFQWNSQGTSTPFGTGTLTLAGGARIGSTFAADATLANNIVVTNAGSSVVNSLVADTNGIATDLYVSGSVTGNGILSNYIQTNTSGNHPGNAVTFTGDMSGFSGTYLYTYEDLVSLANNASALAKWIVDTGGANQGLNLTNPNGGTYQFGSLTGNSSGTIGTAVLTGDTNSNAQVQQTGQSYVIQAGALNDASDVYAGTIGDPVGNTYNNTISFVKVGTGGMTLSGANTYTGGTTVSAGTLFVSNSVGTGGSGTGTGAVTVASTGTLRGSGTITPSDGVSGISISGNLHPGDAAVGTTPSGNLTFNLALTSGQAVLQNGATLTFDLGAGGSNPTSALALASDITNELVFNNNTVNLNDLTGGGLNVNTGANQYILIEGSSDTDYSGLTINGVANAQTNGQITAGLILGNNAGYYSSELFLENGDIVVDIVPEPSTWALMLGSLALLVFYQRCRRSRSSSRI